MKHQCLTKAGVLASGQSDVVDRDFFEVKHTVHISKMRDPRDV